MEFLSENPLYSQNYDCPPPRTEIRFQQQRISYQKQICILRSGSRASAARVSQSLDKKTSDRIETIQNATLAQFMEQTVRSPIFAHSKRAKTHWDTVTPNYYCKILFNLKLQVHTVIIYNHCLITALPAVPSEVALALVVVASFPLSVVSCPSCQVASSLPSWKHFYFKVRKRKDK